MDVTLTVANLHVPLHEIVARGLKNGNAEVQITISTQGRGAPRDDYAKALEDPGGYLGGTEREVRFPGGNP